MRPYRTCDFIVHGNCDHDIFRVCNNIVPIHLQARTRGTESCKLIHNEPLIKPVTVQMLNARVNGRR